MFKQTYSFDDIGLRPNKKSEIESRTGVQTISYLFGCLEMSLPIFPSPMKLVTGERMVEKMDELGGIGFLPRSDDKYYDARIIKHLIDKGLGDFFVSIPAKDFEEPFLYAFDLGIRYFNIDTANGFNSVVETAIKEIRKGYPGTYLVAGNVASVEGYKFLADLGVDGVRLGIGNGSICLTSAKTSIGVGQATLIREIATYRNVITGGCGPAIICDGSVKGTADCVKAIALGCDGIISGKLFASCKESPGPVVKFNEKLYKQYGGQTSYAVKKSKKNIEGDDTLIPYTGSVEVFWHSLGEAFRSAMSYMNCKYLSDFKYLPDEDFVLLSNSAKIERLFHA